MRPCAGAWRRIPATVFAEMGGRMPEGLDIKVVCDSDKVRYLHIPSPPPMDEISDEDLQMGRGGSLTYCVILGVGVAMAAATAVGYSVAITVSVD